MMRAPDKCSEDLRRNNKFSSTGDLRETNAHSRPSSEKTVQKQLHATPPHPQPTIHFRTRSKPANTPKDTLLASLPPGFLVHNGRLNLSAPFFRFPCPRLSRFSLRPLLGGRLFQAVFKPTRRCGAVTRGRRNTASPVRAPRRLFPHQAPWLALSAPAKNQGQRKWGQVVCFVGRSQRCSPCRKSEQNRGPLGKPRRSPLGDAPTGIPDNPTSASSGGAVVETVISGP